MTEESLSQTVTTAVTAYRLGMEGAASDALTRATQLMEKAIGGWEEQDLKILADCLSRVFAAQTRKNYLYAADMLEYQLLPFLMKRTMVKGDQG